MTIFERVEEPADLENCANASPYFSQLLEDRRVEYLFPKVLPHIVKWCMKNDPTDDDYDDSSDYNSSDEEAELNNEAKVGKSRYKLEILKLRPVCQFWSKAVDNYMLEHPSHFEIDEVRMEHLKFDTNNDDSDSDCESICTDDFYVDWKIQHLRSLKVSESQQVDKFLEAFEDSPPNRNPLFHRKLIIQDYRGDNSTACKEEARLFWESVSSLLKKYGDQIWFCEIRLHNSFLMEFSYYLKIREWLELMKNLKALVWVYPQKWSDLEESDGVDFDSTIPTFLEFKLKDKVLQNPLPKLEHLQIFKTDDLPFPIFREFIKRNDHLSKVQFHRKFPSPPRFQEFYNYGFGNAFQNAIELSIVIWCKQELEELEASASTAPWRKLEKLSFYWGRYHDQEYGYQKWTQVFNVIEKKCTSGSLKSLKLKLPNPWIPQWKVNDESILQTPASLRFNLPFLRTLTVLLPGKRATLDFLLPMKGSLEHLDIALECDGGINNMLRMKPTDLTESPTVEFLGYIGRLTRSNIWKLFPKLGKIQLKLIDEERSRQREYLALRKNVPAEILQGISE